MREITQAQGRSADAAAPSRFLRITEVCNLVGLSAPAVYRRVSAGTFPKQIKLGGHVARWDECSILAWMDAQRAGVPAGDPTHVPAE